MSYRKMCVRIARIVSIAWLLLVLSVMAISSHQGLRADEIPDGVPWDLKKLSDPPQWSYWERPKIDGVRAVSFSGQPYEGHPTRVFAWLGIPEVKNGEKVPAMVLVHGGGGTAFEEWVRLWVKRGYAAIAMDTCGQVPVGNYGHYVQDSRSGPPGWGGFDQIDRPRQDQWTYHAVANVILAHSLVRSLPDVDPDRVGITGISWGGYLTCIVAGVDSRFKLAVPVYGCGCYRQTVFADRLRKLSTEQADQWMAWWDPSNYLPTAKMPMLWVTGSNDFAYPLPALQCSYRLALGPRTLCVRLRMPHAHGGAGENPREIHVFADSLLKDGTALPHFTDIGQDGRTVWADFQSDVPVAKAELNYTCDTGNWREREWQAMPADVNAGRVTADLPEAARVYYLNLFDDRDCVVSTEHHVIKDGLSEGKLAPLDRK